ncbi:MAG: N-6 DNA methylase [Sulfurovum sp.]|nr:N-6 DNA methylase [Sulfurovum sp.]
MREQVNGNNEVKYLISDKRAKEYISLDEEHKTITYLYQNKTRNYANPEEKVQAEIFLKLILEYNYPVEHIAQFVTVTMGSEKREADIIVYNDKSHLSPHIVIECKKEDISELEFKNAVNQGFSYAVSEGAKYVWTTSGIKDEYYQVPSERPKERITIPDIPKYGIKKISKYKYVKGGKKGEEVFNDLSLVSEENLTKRFKQAHNALWAGGELNPSEAFDELDKLIFCKIWDERNCKRGEPYKFQIMPQYIKKDGKEEYSQKLSNDKLLERINELYEEGRKKDPEVFKDGVRLNAEKIHTVVGYLEAINLNKTDLDSKGRAFETFMGSFFRGDFGQYFTPRAIVKFIVDILPIKKDSYVLDTSCGSGGFLLHALEKVRQQANKEFPDFKTDVDDAKDHHKYWHDFAEHYLYGIEINEQIARTAKMNMIIHDDGHTNVISCDGLLQITPEPEPLHETDDEKEARLTKNANTIQVKGRNPRFKEKHFDFIITNPPFGSSVKQTEKAYLHQYGFGQKSADWLDTKNTNLKNRDSQSTEVLFIEQAYNFLKDGGYLAVVIPDGILTNSSMQYVRDSIEEMYRIVAVVSMPQTAFSATGAGVKSSILFLKKYTDKQSNAIKSLKLNLQDKVKTQYEYISKIKTLEDEKKIKAKELASQYAKGSDTLKEARAILNQEHKEKVDQLKDLMIDSYNIAKEEALKAYDYDIFMAIAEDIGYDAVGKETHNNELDYISQELAKFIKSIENE